MEKHLQPFGDTSVSNGSEAIRHLKEDIANGKHWYIALLEAIGQWTVAEDEPITAAIIAISSPTKPSIGCSSLSACSLRSIISFLRKKCSLSSSTPEHPLSYLKRNSASSSARPNTALTSTISMVSPSRRYCYSLWRRKHARSSEHVPSMRTIASGRRPTSAYMAPP